MWAEDILNSAQSLFLALHSEITPVGVWGSYEVPEIESKSAVWKENVLTATLSLWTLLKF